MVKIIKSSWLTKAELLGMAIIGFCIVSILPATKYDFTIALILLVIAITLTGGFLWNHA